MIVHAGESMVGSERIPDPESEGLIPVSVSTNANVSDTMQTKYTIRRSVTPQHLHPVDLLTALLSSDTLSFFPPRRF